MVDTDNCPYCNSPMENGYIAGNTGLWWTNRPLGRLARRRDGDIQLDFSCTGWAKISANRCESCKIIITQHD